MEDPLNFREMFKDDQAPEEPVVTKNHRTIYVAAAALLATAIAYYCYFPVVEFIQYQREQKSISSLDAINERVIKKLTDNHVLAVDLSGQQITPDILSHLKNLRFLKTLELNDSKITDDDLAALKGMKSLNSLNLNNTAITDAGLVHLAAMQTLDELYLKGTRITDAGLVHLKGLVKLTSLDLSETQITDDGLTSLRGLNFLNFLYLNGTPITDAGLNSLLDLYSLLKVELYETKVTVEGNRLFMFKTLKCQTQFSPSRRYDQRKRR